MHFFNGQGAFIAMRMVEYRTVVCAHDAISALHNNPLLWYNQQAHEN